jgi:hypothetical protein
MVYDLAVDPAGSVFQSAAPYRPGPAVAGNSEAACDRAACFPGD